MSQPIPTFQALDLSYDLIAALPDVIRAVSRRDRSLADQLRRAAQSVALNLAESTGHEAGNRRQRIRSAFGSAQETKTALRIARGWRYVDAADAERAYVLADRIAGACWRLLHKR
ncbi:MAG: four helix bundle protein [Sandaracinus sp.]|nr:four helix bundle protein [Sandaracinus sp.]MCB9624895.1 four helix bundle protein [Sandaracinus sp.]